MPETKAEIAPRSAETTPDRIADPEERAKRLGRGDWLSLAQKVLVEEGIDQVKIQVMAKRLNVARSSFYWHFSSREDLFQAMLDDWLNMNTGPIIERALRPAPDIVAAVTNVFECWVDEALFDPELDIAVRLWARRSEKVRAVVLQADSMRLDALHKMFARYGCDDEEALIRARVLYYTQIGQHTLEDTETPAQRFSHGPAYLHIFTGQAPDETEVAALKTIIREKYNPKTR
ncbi:TetR/AcrR family transcriptional regulator [Ferrimonas balearica]|nr:TetR/AcrR family transcriptional regulator [Ferrimonas balearica]